MQNHRIIKKEVAPTDLIDSKEDNSYSNTDTMMKNEQIQGDEGSSVHYYLNSHGFNENDEEHDDFSDNYDAFLEDDFVVTAVRCCGGGTGVKRSKGKGKQVAETSRRKKGNGHQTDAVYSSKHIRAKESLREAKRRKAKTK